MSTSYPSIVYRAGQTLEANIQNTFYVCTVVSGPDANHYYQVRFSNGAVQPVHLRDLRQNAPAPTTPAQPVVASAIPVTAQPVGKQPLDATPVAAVSTQYPTPTSTQYPTPVTVAPSTPVLPQPVVASQERVYPVIPARAPVVVAAKPVVVAPAGQVVVAAQPVVMQKPVVKQVVAAPVVQQKAPVKFKTVTTTTKKRVGNKIITTTTTKRIPIDPNAPTTISFNVLCPKNVGPGAVLNVNHQGKNYKVKVPPRHRPGTNFKVTVTTTRNR